MNKSKTSNNPERPAAAKGCLIVMSAPSGCGKTTIADRLLKRHPDWVRSISMTTRLPREGEKNGADYFFVSTDEFKQLEQKGDLLESAQVFNHSYGTPRHFIEAQLEAGKTVLLTIDVQGTAQVKKKMRAEAPLLTVFILPPSVKVLRERLEGRNTDSSDEIEKRIQKAQDEIKEAGWYDAAIVNQNLDQTIVEIEAFIEKSKKERSE